MSNNTVRLELTYDYVILFYFIFSFLFQDRFHFFSFLFQDFSEDKVIILRENSKTPKIKKRMHLLIPKDMPYDKIIHLKNVLYSIDLFEMKCGKIK